MLTNPRARETKVPEASRALARPTLAEGADAGLAGSSVTATLPGHSSASVALARRRFRIVRAIPNPNTSTMIPRTTTVPTVSHSA